MRSNLLGGTKQFINVGLTITDMDALRWLLEKVRGLLEVLQPPNALLGFNGDPCRVDLAPKRSDPFEFLSGPHFTALSPGGSPRGSPQGSNASIFRMSCTFRVFRPIFASSFWGHA